MKIVGGSRLLKYVGLSAKLALSIGLLGLVVSRIDTSHAIQFLLQPATAYGIVVAATALILQGFLAAGRQIALLGLLDQRLTYAQSLQVWFSGLFVTQVAVTFIAGDIVRSILLASDGVPRRAAGRAIILDRIVGLAVLLVMVDAVLPYVATLTSDSNLRLGFLLMAAASAGGVLALLLGIFARRFVEMLPGQISRYRPVEIAIDLVGVSRFLFMAPSPSLRILALSLVMHLCNITGIVAIALAMGAQASIWAMAAIAVPVMLLALLPISFAGWGVREAALITGFGLLHLPAALALAISIGFGMSVILASLPGMFVLMQKQIDWQALFRSPELPRS